MKFRQILQEAKARIQRVLHSRGKNHQKSALQLDPDPASIDRPPLGQTSSLPRASSSLNENIEAQATNVTGNTPSITPVSEERSGTSVADQLCLERNTSPSLEPDAEDSACPEVQVLGSISSLWDEAYEKLSTDENTVKVFESYEKILANSGKTEGSGSVDQVIDGKSKRQKHMDVLIKERTKEIESGAWKIHFKGHELAAKDFVQSVASIVEWGKGLVNAAVQASPPAALAWAGVCLLLPLLLAPGQQDASRVDGLEKIAGIIRECSLRENLYHDRYESATGTGAQTKSIVTLTVYRESIKSLYSEVLLFQATYVCFLCKNNTGQRWIQDVIGKHNWSDMIQKISRKNEELRFQDQKLNHHAQQEEWEAVANRHKESVAKTGALQEEVERIRKLIIEAKSEDARVDLLLWLQKVTPSTHYDAAVAKRRTHATGNWFMQNKIFKDWSENSNSFLWVIGKAGAGKSVLSSTIIEHLQTSRGHDPYIAVAYFYISSSDKETCSINNLTRSLVTQLFGSRPETPRSLLRLGEYRHTSGGPPQAKLEEALRSAVSDFQRTYVVIDGLDECPGSGNNDFGQVERRILLELIETMQSWRLANLHLLVTSRREQDIEDALQGMLQRPHGEVIDLATNVYSSHVRDDIDVFIDEELKQGIFGGLPTDLKTMIRKGISDKADGVFHYASLQLDSFYAPVTRRSVEIILESLPKDLNATYERALVHRLRPEQKDAACNALTWLAFSLVPLTITELAAAVPICLPKDCSQSTDTPEEDYSTPPFDQKGSIESPKQVLYLLPGLHSLQTREPVENGETIPVPKDNIEPDETVVLTHFTLLEYLISDNIKTQATQQFALSRTTANLQLADACLRYHVYLSHQGHGLLLLSNNFKAENPLWRYVARHGLRHAEIAGRRAWPGSLRRLILYIFQDEAGCLATLKLHSGYPLHRGRDLPVQYAIDQKLLETFEFLFEEGLADVNLGPRGRERLLVQAVENMDLDVAKSLLEKYPAIANAKSEKGEPVVLVAYRKKDVSMVELLLAHGADINVLSEAGEPAAVVSYKEKDITMVELLLAHGENINASNRMGETLLFEVAFSHDAEMAARLVKDGAKIHATRLGETGFHWAAYHDSPRLADILLSAGGSKSKMNAGNGKGETPLHWAAEYGHQKMLQWLLENGAEVNAKMNDGGTSLHIAATRDDLKTMTLLLDHGVDINAVNGAGETALFLATRYHERRSHV